eukprot:1058574_1
MAYLKLYMVVILIISNINGVSARCVGEQCDVTAVREGERMTQCAALRKNHKLNCKWLANYLYTPQSGVELDRPSDFPPVRFEFNNDGWVESVTAAIIPLVSMPTRSSTPAIFNGYDPPSHGNVYQFPPVEFEFNAHGWVESVKAAILPLVSMPTRSYTPVIFNKYEPHAHGNVYQRGHIIGLSLGGPNRAINIVSQMAGWQANGPWHAMEVAVRRFAIETYGFAYIPVKTGTKTHTVKSGHKVTKNIYELKTTETKAHKNGLGLIADGEPQLYRSPPHSLVYMKVKILYEHRDNGAGGVKVPSKFIVSWWNGEETWQWTADQIYVELPAGTAVFRPYQLPRTEPNRHRESPDIKGGDSAENNPMKHVKILEKKNGIQDSFILDSEYMMENIKFLFWCMLAAIGFCFTSFTAILMICVYKRIMKGDSDERISKRTHYRII